jgi:hypothetical protein
MLLIFIVSGCAYIDMFKNRTLSREYLDVLNSYTRTKTLYSELDTRLHISATLKSREFQEAYLKEYSRLNELTAAEKKVQTDNLEGTASEYTEFFLYAYVPEKDTNDFASPNSLWRIFLINGTGAKIYPLEIRKIEHVNALLEEFFPYIKKHYGFCYLVKFPVDHISVTVGGKIARTLVVTGALGNNIELEWN